MKRKTLVKTLCFILSFLLAAAVLTSCSFEDIAGSVINRLVEELGTAEPSDIPDETPYGDEPSDNTPTPAPSQNTPESTKKNDEPSSSPAVTWEDNYVPSYRGSTVRITKSYNAVPADYYWRETLSSKYKKAYDEILSGALKYQEKIAISTDVSFSEIESIYRLFTLDHPEIFWYYDGFYATGPSDNIDAINLGLLFDKSEIPAMKQKVEAAARKIVDTVPSGASDIEAELILYEYLAKNVKYDLNADNAYSLYGALIGKKCVCQGFAEAFQYMCYMVGIPCIGITGEATNNKGVTEAHKWNGVKIGGKWYPVDVTFGEGGIKSFPQYFNNDAKIRTNHTVHQAIKKDLPSFSSDNAEYFKYFGLTFNSGSFYDTLMRAIGHFSENREKDSLISYVMLKAESASDRSAIQKLLESGSDDYDCEYLEKIIGDYNAVFSDRFEFWKYEFDGDVLVIQIFRV